MTKLRLTKEFSFESAHMLSGYDGACSQLHGHSYRLFVTVIGSPLCDDASPKNGMVMDFGLLKKAVKETIIDRFDHATVVRKGRDEQLENILTSRFERIIMVGYQPTCENMIAEFAASLTAVLPPTVKLHSLRLHETATSFIEWYAEDNR